MMTIFAVLLVALCCARVVVPSHEESPTKFSKMAMIIIVVVAILFMGLFIKAVVITGAEEVLSVHRTRDDTQTLYIEDDSGKYFVIMKNRWNPFQATYREYIDTEKAEAYIAEYNKFHSLKLVE